MTPEEALANMQHQVDLRNQQPLIPGMNGLPAPPAGKGPARQSPGGSSPVRKFAQTMGANSQGPQSGGA